MTVMNPYFVNYSEIVKKVFLFSFYPFKVLKCHNSLTGSDFCLLFTFNFTYEQVRNM